MVGAHILTATCSTCGLNRTGKPGDIVIALIDGESTVKYLAAEDGRVFLRAANPAYADIHPLGDLVIQGKVLRVIRDVGDDDRRFTGAPGVTTEDPENGRRNGTGGPIMQRVVRFFQEAGWQYQQIGDMPALRCSTRPRMRDTGLSLQWTSNWRLSGSTPRSTRRCPKTGEPRAAEFLTRANFGLLCGNSRWTSTTARSASKRLWTCRTR